MRQLAKTSELLKLNDIFVFLQLFNKHDQKSGLLLTLGDLWGGGQWGYVWTFMLACEHVCMCIYMCTYLCVKPEVTAKYLPQLFSTLLTKAASLAGPRAHRFYWPSSPACLQNVLCSLSECQGYRQATTSCH